LQFGTAEQFDITYQHKTKSLSVNTTSNSDDVMLVRKRKSRIFFNGTFYDYPISLSWNTLKNLGIVRTLKIGFSYLKSLILPRKKEHSLEDFFINRFGTELYKTFFKTYTEKVWGMPCHEIGADWGRQRVKGLSVSKAIKDSIFKLFRKSGFRQKNVETSLIEYFLYPKYGPGHMWEVVTDKIRDMGGEIITNAHVKQLVKDNNKITAIAYAKPDEEILNEIDADYVLSTMPIKELFENMSPDVPADIHSTATALQYRDFITIGILVKSDKLRDIEDNWIYIHDPDVHVGRIQFFHNWSPAMVQTKDSYLLGLEYFCNEGDNLWNMTAADLSALAIEEMKQIGILSTGDAVINTHVEKVEKAYPVYAGAYSNFEHIQEYLNTISNLYPMGRNGMHRYNNQDHSMLTAMASVESILGTYDKPSIWNINAEQEYHEQK
jgi:protoporphyrinogen oxidase